MMLYAYFMILGRLLRGLISHAREHGLNHM
jgi:hypothetical protein